MGRDLSGVETGVDGGVVVDGESEGGVVERAG